MTTPPETITAAAAWASGHGCHNIGSCSATPLEAFIAGAAAERDRIRQLATNLAKTTSHGASRRGYHALYDFADLLDGDQP